MSKTKKFAALLLVLAMVFSLAACGNKNEEEEEQTEGFDYSSIYDEKGYFKDVHALDYVTLAAYDKISVSSDDIESQIEYFLAQHPDEQAVTDRAVEDGDTVNIDYEGKVDGEANNLSMMRPDLSWVDFYRDGLPHQSTFIKRSLFDRLGLYDENLKAVSDWKFFVDAFVYHKATSEFIPKKVAVYAEGGISDVMGCEERKRVAKELFPRAMIETIPVIESHKRIQHHRLTSKLYSFVDRLAKRLERRGER